MASSRITQGTERKQLRLVDMFGLAAGAVLLLVGLSVAATVASGWRKAKAELPREEIVENARKEAVKAALAHREGTILFVDPDACQEHSFDNWTGNQAYREKIDCDARLEALRKSDNDRAAERMRSITDGFRR